MSEASPATFFKEDITFFLPGIILYFGLKPFSISIPISFAGRSLIWPTVATTL